MSGFERFAVRSEPGSPLRAILPVEGTARFDPFLVFHEQGPVTYAPRTALGFPDHPHRGFETITYLMAGEQEHRDSFGHRGVLHAGDVQWMRAAAGIVHAEVPTERLFETGGTVHSVQIWLNLPAARKMERPRYQDVRANDLPRLDDDRRAIRVIVGTHRGHTSPVDAERPALVLHATIGSGASETIVPPPGATTIVYAMQGSALLGDERLDAAHVAVVRDADAIALRALDDVAAIVLAAQPLHEPVVSRGPFVMNTHAEIERAYDDLLAGRLGAEALIG